MSLADEIDVFCGQLRARQVQEPLLTAKRTAYLMRLLTTTKRHGDAQALLDDVRMWGTKLQLAKPSELAIGNIIRRVMHIIREEAQQELESTTPAEAQGAAAESVVRAKRQGLLSKALQHPGVSASRALSLHNLLDFSLPPYAPTSAEAAAVAEALAKATPTIPEGPGPGPASDVLSDTGRRRKSSRSGPVWQGKNAVIEQLNELIDELDEIAVAIAQQAHEHIHANEVILTFGVSETTLLFLKEAAKKRSFQVVVAEAAPGYGGHSMAVQLAKAGLHTTAIADSAIFALMARVNKVVLGARALLANGGIIAETGTQLVALAAKRHAVPLVVLVGLYKLSPLFPHDPTVTFNDFKSPADIIDFDVLAEPVEQQEASTSSSTLMTNSQMTDTQSTEDAATSSALREAVDATATPSAPEVHVLNPAFDYVPPELISLFVTDTGGYTPSYVYRLLSEYYARDDYMLSKELMDTLVR